ncbi:hypothetical protein Vafri_20485 [Volvox africanus]|uniref:Uncharacterized protein n=1 Tax=Volvox africanus TaxID=51714 RepID=A0A8J4F9N0_9CHLO|nr:hypothetical protein Vafri_20485 [Volvox africanus]
MSPSAVEKACGLLIQAAPTIKQQEASIQSMEKWTCNSASNDDIAANKAQDCSGGCDPSPRRPREAGSDEGVLLKGKKVRYAAGRDIRPSRYVRKQVGRQVSGPTALLFITCWLVQNMPGMSMPISPRRSALDLKAPYMWVLKFNRPQTTDWKNIR